MGYGESLTMQGYERWRAGCVAPGSRLPSEERRMDGTGFDALTRRLAERPSRRRVVTAFGGVVLAALLARPSGALAGSTTIQIRDERSTSGTFDACGPVVAEEARTATHVILQVGGPDP